MDIAPEPESEAAFSCRVCGRQNLSLQDMMFSCNSVEGLWKPFLCKECYPNHKTGPQWEFYLERKRQEAEQDQIRKAAVQEVARRLRQDAETLP